MRSATLLMIVGLAAVVGADHSDLMQKAIEQSRQRQSSRISTANKPPAASAAGAAGGKKGTTAQQRPLGQSKSIDVDALNNLIKSFDKTWVHPKAGSKEPVGSNFQYKKTCASIYKARPGACSQLGFGSMCFNYCFEKGEKVTYQCADASDAAYCKSSSNFDAYLTKYKKDAYKAKAYVHQMISRCFATALCNGNGILDAHPIETSTQKTREMNHLKLTKPATSNSVTKKSPVKATAAPPAVTTTEKAETEAPVKPTNARPKKVPEWQKLMAKATTQKSAKKKEEEEEEEEISATTDAVEESMEEVEVEEEETTVASTTRRSRKETSKKTAATTTTEPSTTTAASRATFKPLRITPTPPVPSVEEAEAASHTGEKTPKEDTFWNRFQPNTWYQSIHYLTNTGR